MTPDVQVPVAPMQVLLVEDSPTDRLLTRAALDRLGDAVALHMVPNGLDALKFLRRQPPYGNVPRPDLILLDLNMPLMDGREVLRRVKADRKLQQIPVVVLTTSAAPEDVEAAYSAHANSYVTKPIDFGDFDRILEILREYWSDVVTLAPRPDESDGGSPAPGPGGADVRILLVEDSDSDALLIRHALRESDRETFTVVRVSGVGQATALPEDEDFDVILTDLGLPGASGVEAVEQLRGWRPGTPVVVLTGRESEFGDAALDAGADDYLRKDEVTPAAIARTLRFAIQRFRSRTDREQVQRMETVGRLAAGVAHDFNNLLTAIAASAELARDESDAPARERLLEDIGETVARGRGLTSQVLALSRGDDVELRPVDGRDPLRSAEALLRRLAGPGIEIRTRCDPSPLPILGDATQVEQVLLNLGLNARDALEGRGSITLSAHAGSLDEAAGRAFEPELAPGEYLVYGVSDDGPGVPVPLRTRIFEPFFTTKGEGIGTGLGLDVVQRITVRHGGGVRLLENRQGGAHFQVLIPVAGPDVPLPSAGDAGSATQVAAGGASSGSPVPEAPSGAANRTILVVEDEPAVRNAVRRILIREGFQVLEADTGAQGLRVWQEGGREVDLVLSDIVMPGPVHAFDMTARMRDERPGLPIVYMSGYPGYGADRRDPLVEGENFLAKPFDIRELVRLVRSRLGSTRTVGG